MSVCTIASLAGSEPLAGTAALAATWLLIEQPGPWGAKALVESRLDRAVGRALTAATDSTGVRAALIRRPGRAPAGRRVFVAHTAPGNAWIRTTADADPLALPALDFARLGAGHHDGLWEPHSGPPLTLVCTNGTRDRCCALLGRPLAAELTAAGGADVWEITHLGGHRFSPTLLTLPHGYAYGRMTPVAVKSVVTALAEGRVSTDGCRGRSTWDRPGQAAELAVRALTGESGADDLTAVTAGTTPAWTVTVAHRDGRRWRVAVTEETTGERAPASCDAAPGPVSRMNAASVERIAGTGRNGRTGPAG
ncbi:sucrase ferredoxin [Streptomyces sp. SBT349]|uniref:sucrase ferredoxin n=1 Tax=Streptomyces sp. SBT349 TaxID=1580539 RepID=UPI00066A780A|nr:sucrase ferredoxin [Streptomyces sp. SBT349]